MKIKVVDSIMGSGKTSAAIQLMNSDTENNYIFITPYLDEVERIKEQCPNKKFYDPKIFTKDGNTHYKLDSLHSLITNGKNIATTHQLFKTANEQTKELLYLSNYTLILDEVMEVVTELKVKPKDVEMLINEKWIYIENNLVLWNHEKEKQEGNYDGVFQSVKRLAIRKHLTLHNKKILIWNFPADIFTLFNDVYILTYLFNGQIQKYYFDLHNLEYEKYTVKNEKDKYYFVPGQSNDKELKSKIKSLINIYDGSLNKIGEKDFSLSLSWHKDSSKFLLDKLKNNIYNYFRTKSKTKSNENMWTTFKDFRGKMSGKGYTKGFVSCNLRATNEYKHKIALAYTINRFLHPTIYDYFKTESITIDNDLFALSELIQWIWRSRIRDDKEIFIYIPSKRMRNLLIEWLNNSIN